jgi:hypothetical protein
MEHEERAERLEQEADYLEAEGDQLDDRIDEAKKDWESKQRDPDVPGAQPPPENDDAG